MEADDVIQTLIPPRGKSIRSGSITRDSGWGSGGLTTVELLVVVGLLLIISGTVYAFFRHYFRSYTTIDDKLENVSESWQVLRVANDDLFCADFPGGDPGRWAEAVQSDSAGFRIVRRRGDSLVEVRYRIDQGTGDLFREEGGKSVSLIRGRLKSLSVKTESRNTQKNGLPGTLSFKVEMEIENRLNIRDQAAPVMIGTNVVPVFLNRRLNHSFLVKGLP